MGKIEGLFFFVFFGIDQFYDLLSVASQFFYVMNIRFNRDHCWKMFSFLIGMRIVRIKMFRICSRE